MLRKIVIPPTAEPRVLLLDQTDEHGEVWAAVVFPGRLPVKFRNLSRALEAIKLEGRA